VAGRIYRHCARVSCKQGCGLNLTLTSAMAWPFALHTGGKASSRSAASPGIFDCCVLIGPDRRTAKILAATGADVLCTQSLPHMDDSFANPSTSSHT